MISKEIGTPSLEKNNPANNTKAAIVHFETLQYRENSQEEEKRAVDFTRYIATVMQNEEYFIDNGGAARVYDFPNQTSTCFKVMKNRHIDPNASKYDLGAAPTQEFSFMEKVRGLEKLGCRAPIPEMCIESGDTSMIVMEKLPAINLQHIFNGKGDLPEGFDYEIFTESLQEYIDALHTEKRIVHGDLYARNVMVDTDTGLPYVIDFGRSRSIEKDAEEVAQVHAEKDWARFDEIFLQLENLRHREKVSYEEIPIPQDTYFFDGKVTVHYSKRILEEVLSIINSKNFDASQDVSIGLGSSKDLIITRDKDKVRGVKQIQKGQDIFYIGRKRKEYAV